MNKQPTYKDALELVNNLHRIQKNEPESRSCEYMRGMYNGIEIIRASLSDNILNLIDVDGKFESEASN